MGDSFKYAKSKSIDTGRSYAYTGTVIKHQLKMYFLAIEIYFFSKSIQAHVNTFYQTHQA